MELRGTKKRRVKVNQYLGEVEKAHGAKGEKKYYPMEENLMETMGMPAIRDGGLSAREKEVQLCREFIWENLEKTPGARRGRSSYSYKHAVERHYGVYISNRDFIVAMFLEGYKLTPCERGRINFWFNAKFKKNREFLHYQDSYTLERKKQKHDESMEYMGGEAL